MIPEKPTLTVESMENESKDALAVPFTFYSTNKLADNCLFCFVEGKTDSDYYYPKIKILYGTNCLIVNCNCKKNVLAMYDKVYPVDHATKKLAFFIDHDYDASITRPNLFETECYSIENYYTHPSSFSEFLQHGLHVPSTEFEFTNAMNFYQAAFDGYHASMLEFNAWIAVCKDKQKTCEMRHLEKLGDTPPEDFLNIEFGSTYSQLYTLDILNDHFKADPRITNEELQAKKIELQSKNFYDIFRGKYELGFLCKLLLNLKHKAEHTKKEKRTTLEKNIVSMNFDLKNLMKNYSAYAYFPKSLRKFILSFTA